MKTTQYRPKTGVKCGCRRGIERDNCAACEGTGWRIDFRAIRERKTVAGVRHDGRTGQYVPQVNGKDVSPTSFDEDRAMEIARQSVEPPLFEQVKAAGIQHDSHATDLYLPVNEQTRALIAGYRFKENVTQFISQIDGKRWYDVPFAYLPAWDAKQKRGTP